MNSISPACAKRCSSLHRPLPDAKLSELEAGRHPAATARFRGLLAHHLSLRSFATRSGGPGLPMFATGQLANRLLAATAFALTRRSGA